MFNLFYLNNIDTIHETEEIYSNFKKIYIKDFQSTTPSNIYIVNPNVYYYFDISSQINNTITHVLYPAKIYNELSIFCIDLNAKLIFIYINFKMDTTDYIRNAWITDNNISYLIISDLILKYNIQMDLIKIVLIGKSPEIMSYIAIKNILYPNSKSQIENTLTKGILSIIQ